MPAFDTHKNFAYSTVATAPSPAASGTSLVVQAGDGAKFPTPPFNATVWPSSANPTTLNGEIVRVTAVSTDIFTITRGQEGTVAQSIAIGYQIAATITAKTLTDIETGYSSGITFNLDDSYKRLTITDPNVNTTSKIVISVYRTNNTTDATDQGWVYVANIASISNGSFDVVICCFDWDGPVTTKLPQESISIFYHVWS